MLSGCPVPTKPKKASRPLKGKAAGSAAAATASGGRPAVAAAEAGSAAAATAPGSGRSAAAATTPGSTAAATTEPGSGRSGIARAVASVTPVPFTRSASRVLKSKVAAGSAAAASTPGSSKFMIRSSMPKSALACGAGAIEPTAAARNAPAVVGRPTTAQTRSLALRDRVFRFACRPANIQPLLESIADTGVLSPAFASYSTHVE